MKKIISMLMVAILITCNFSILTMAQQPILPKGAYLVSQSTTSCPVCPYRSLGVNIYYQSWFDRSDYVPCTHGNAKDIKYTWYERKVEYCTNCGYSKVTMTGNSKTTQKCESYGDPIIVRIEEIF